MSLDNTQHTRQVEELVERMRDTISEVSESSSQSPPATDTRPPTAQSENQTRSEGESQSTSQRVIPIQEQSTTESEEERQERLLQRQQEEMRVAEELMANELRQERLNQQTTGTPKKRMKIDDVKEIDQIDSLSVQQLKEILVTNFVDYKGCVEKYELMDRVRRLWREHQNNKKKASNNEEEICKICMDAAVDCVLLECGHMVSCTQCGRRLAECPVCRQYVVRAVHLIP
ncbi:hypothetical protein KUTeg_010255 [Tegillarca granosa]|uniref:RING-type domain-containing protein n=1 Tax=Tegillarca granosa TaxID=220873 RepID=A0ABQ9FAM4_TEGGR|nr:hypothetical protein KUTeg_010255 [Tegillarca granosa]